MVNLKYELATVEHLHYIAEHMREADRIEVEASHGHTPLGALLSGFECSQDVVTAFGSSGRPLFVFGVNTGTVLSNSGVIWALGCDELLDYKYNFIMDFPLILKLLLDKYKKLENYVHVKNVVSVAWLKKVGFIMDEPVLFTHSGEYFMHFHMERA